MDYLFRKIMFLFLIVLFLATPFISVNAQSEQVIQKPADFFGFEPGSDRNLFVYEKLIEYLKKLDAVSPRLTMQEIGKSPMGKPMYIAFFSTEENLNNLENYKEINRKLAIDPDIPEAERETMIKNGKVFVTMTLSMHSGEVAPSQSAPLIAYEYVTTQDSQMLEIFQNVVYMMVPCHNPDGMDMIVNHYNKYKGTKYEGSSMPGIYHKYVGHDNNRDFVTLTQSDTRAIANIFNKDWFPQVMVEKHQMGSRGPRYFVPPMHDPITENIAAELWNWTWVFGSNMIKDMTAAGLSGISQHYLFDDYWPGSTETCIWKNVIGMLTEAASVRYAKPIYVEPTELSVYGKGLSEYKKSINMPDPWPGGWWRLSDIIQYEIESTKSVLKTASLQREEILRYRNDLCKDEVNRGKTEAPYYYILPIKQHDQSELVNLVNLLNEHGVNVYQLNSLVVIDNRNYLSGDIVVTLAQAFRPFIKEVMEKQNFPLRHYTPGGKIIKPYDIASWSLPLHKGVKSYEIEIRSEELEKKIEKINFPFNLKDPITEDIKTIVFSANNNESYKAAFSAIKKSLKVYRLDNTLTIDETVLSKGSFVLDNPTESKFKSLFADLNVSPIFTSNKISYNSSQIKLPRIALVESYFHDMDAGWTRYIFDTYNIPYKVIRPGDISKTNLSGKFDVVIFPNENKDILMKGKWKSDDDYMVTSYPPEYTKGIEKKGMEKITQFIEDGGLIISWGESTGLFDGTLEIVRDKDNKEEFQLPFDDISKKLSKEGLYCPGSLVKIKLLKDHPITVGLPDEIGVFFRGKPVFKTSSPIFDMDRRVIATFPEKDILMSGYAEKIEKVGNKNAIVWLKKGKGQLVLMGFNPQFRASTEVSYKLLFNSILMSKN
jgi:zinc carboxypeptidase